MIQIKKPKYEHDNYCTCCRKPFEDSMEVSFSHKDYNDSVNITLCGKCRAELMEALDKANANLALDHIHNVVRDDAYRRGYEQGKADSAPKWIPFTADTMPKKDGEYLIIYEDGYAEDYDLVGRVGVADFYVDCEAFGYWQERYDPVSLGFVDCDFTEIKVKKWMPIPKEE